MLLTIAMAMLLLDAEDYDTVDVLQQTYDKQKRSSKETTYWSIPEKSWATSQAWRCQDIMLTAAAISRKRG